MFLYKHFAQRDPGTEKDDIQRNLEYVLHSKRGSGYFLQNFGLHEVGYRTPEEMLLELSEEIRENIMLFEPRVELIRIDEDFDDEGQQSKLVVYMRLRSTKEKLAFVVNVEKKTIMITPLAESGKK